MGIGAFQAAGVIGGNNEIIGDVRFEVADEAVDTTIDDVGFADVNDVAIRASGSSAVMNPVAGEIAFGIGSPGKPGGIVIGSLAGDG